MDFVYFNKSLKFHVITYSKLSRYYFKPSALNYCNCFISDFAPIILQKLPESINLTEGDKLTLKAKVGGKPMPTVKW